MGAGASLVQQTPFPVELHDSIKADLEKLQLQGLPDDEILSKLTEDYNERIEKAKAEAKEMAPLVITSKLLPGEGVGSPVRTSEVSPQKQAKKKGGGARRQSFSPDAVLPTKAAKPAAAGGAGVDAAISESVSTPALPTLDGLEAPTLANALGATDPQLQKDSWDSVSEQPACVICSMTFPNKSKLDRHVKYSDMHAKMVEKLEKAASAPAEAVEETKPKAAQVEGQHYKLLYSGTKKFWRTRDTIDLHIYLHVLCNTVEVIPFDVERHKELNRSYLEHFILLSGIEKDAEQRVLDRKELLKAAKAKDKHNKEVLPPEEVMLEEAKRQVLVTHILDRMQILAGPPKQIVYTPSSMNDMPSLANNLTGFSEGVQKPALLTEIPSVLEPVSLTRRRRSNAEDVRQATDNLKKDMKQAKQATGKAQKITELLFAATDDLNQIHKRLEKIRSMKYSRPRMRWIAAIDKVQILHQIARNTGCILAYENRLAGKQTSLPWAEVCATEIANHKKSYANGGRCFFPECMCFQEEPGSVGGSPSGKLSRKSFLNTSDANQKRRASQMTRAHEV